LSAKDILEISSAIMGLLSVSAGIVGTFWLTRLYHAFKPVDFLRAVWSSVSHTARGHFLEALNEARVATRFGGFQPENKAQSLVGVYWVFIGFVLQGIAGVLAVAALLLALH
jgi:hypothetical protein